MFISIKRSIVLGLKNFKRSSGLSFVAVIVLMATSFLSTSLFLAGEISEEMVTEAEKRADISVYFNPPVSEGEIMSIREELEEEFELSTSYISRTEALENFRENFGDDETLMEALDEVGNPFFSSLRISADGVDHYRQIADYLRGNYSESIDEIDFYRRKGAIESIFAITDRIRRSLFVAGGVLALVSVFIVFGVIKLSIYSLSQEIRIMKLVGASNGFIRSSFLIQGFIMGLFAGLLSLIVLLGLAGVMSQGYNVFGIDLEHHIIENMSLIFYLQFSTAVGLSLLSSLLSVGKYLKI